MDNYFLKLINELPHPAWSDEIVLFLSWLGEAKILLSAAAALGVIGLVLKKRKLWFGSLFLALAILASAATVAVMKQIIDRPRPYEVFQDLYVITRSESSSFPSGHAALFAAFGAFMALYFRRAKILWVVIILIGGLARVYQGVHYPSDVLEGWIVAAVIGWAMSKIARSLT